MTRIKLNIALQAEVKQALLGFAGLPSVPSQDRLTRSYGTQVLDTEFRSLKAHKDLCARVESKAQMVMEWYQSRPHLDLTYDLTLDHDDQCHGIINNNIAQRLGYQAKVKPITKEQATISPALINA